MCPMVGLNATAPDVSRTTFADLFSVILTTYGTGDGSTTFNLPNIKGKVIVGYNASETEFDTIGETSGEKAHTLTVNEIPSHNHVFTEAYGGSGAYPDADKSPLVRHFNVRVVLSVILVEVPRTTISSLMSL